MSSAVNVFVHAIRKRSKTCLAQKVDNLRSLGPIPMIKLPFNSYCIALQYEPGTKLFHQAAPELQSHKQSEISVQCNLDYPDPRLSGLAGDQNIDYHACAEGVASDLLWVWSQIG